MAVGDVLDVDPPVRGWYRRGDGTISAGLIVHIREGHGGRVLYGMRWRNGDVWEVRGDRVEVRISSAELLAWQRPPSAQGKGPSHGGSA
jgi:hypothetical protein